MKQLLLLLALPAVLLAACTHTNRLAQFKINGASALYRTTMSSDAASAIAVIESPSKSTESNIITAIGSVIVSAEAEQKLARAMNSDSLAESVGNGIKQSTADYLGIRSVAGMAENPDLIIETELTDCKLLSSSIGLAIHVTGNSRIIDRRTGQIVWENSESHDVPISETYLAAIAPRGVRSGVSIFNAIQLLTLSEQEIRLVVQAAAKDAGREIGETLREDVADLHK